MSTPALVLDFGGPVLLTPFELAGRLPGTAVHELLHEQGPLATADRPDPMWADVQADRLTERAYWDTRAEQWHDLGGAEPTIRSLISSLYQPARPDLVRDQARTVVRDARAAGLPVAVLTNDLALFHSPEWIAAIEIVGDVDVMVDASEVGFYKPDPRIYQLTADRLGLPCGQLVFLDDQRTNIRGAEALGIPSVWFDVSDPDSSFAETRKLLGLPEEQRGG